jgi:cyanophycin synthetase
MLRDQLVINGIDADAIEIIPNEMLAVEKALDMAQEGDLVVLFADDVRRSWDQVIHYEGDNETSSTSENTKSAQSFVEEDPDAFSLDPGERLVRDERGVRLAREEEESD